MALTEKGRKTLIRVAIVAVAILGVLGLRTAAQKGYGRSRIPAFIAGKVELSNDSAVLASNSGAVQANFEPLPSTQPVSTGIPVRGKFWAWNSQMGCFYANGGPVTTEGSLMAEQGIKMTIAREDDNNVLRGDIVALAQGMKEDGPNTSRGVHLIAIMMDGSGAFLQALNDQLHEAVGDEYNAEIVGSCGRSLGEDKLMGPSEWRDNPESLKGSLIAAVVTDGDWNIAVRYAFDNDIKVNPDWTTYDPDAVNFVNTSSYTDAAAKYVQGYSEKRKIIVNGKLTGKDTLIAVQGAATWTPGDVTMARKGGVVSVISTKQYVNQMPNAIITLSNWANKNPSTVEKVLTAFLQGGAQVRAFPKALDRASEISYLIYKKEESPEYWKKYYIGTREKGVDLGGSQAFTLADNLKLFGLQDGGSFENSPAYATYTVFGNLVTKMYPKSVAKVPAPDKAFNLTYLRAVAANNTEAASQASVADAAIKVDNEEAGRIVGKRGVSIEFAKGQAVPTSAGIADLKKLAAELQISGLNIVLHGHTDSDGDAEANMALSEARAFAVKKYLEATGQFGGRSIKVVAHGETEPIAENSTPEGQKKNRRVEVVLVQ